MLGTSRFLFELLLSGLYQLVDQAYVDLAELASQMTVYDRVKTAYNLSQLGVEMVLDAVVRPVCNSSYLPGSFTAMADHLLPTSLCSWMS